MQHHINHLILSCLLLGFAGGVVSCKKDPVGILNTGNFKDTSGGPLKSANDFPFGLAVQYDQMSGNSALASLVAREANSVTFGNELKYGSIVRNDGTFDYTTADAFYNLCTTAGLQVYGHNLCWYQQNNTTYLNKLLGATAGTVTNLAKNGGFETPGGGLFANWTILNHSNGDFAAGSGAGNVHGGAASMEVVTTAGGNNYNTQILSDAINVTAGKVYTFSYWIKGASSGSVQFEIRASPGGAVTYVNGNSALVTTSWSQVSYSYTVPAGQTQISIAFDLGGNANTFHIDDISVFDPSTASIDPVVAGPVVDSVFKLWVTTTVTHYAGKIKAWDVVNEPMSDGNGALRTSKNAPTLPLPAGQFLWSDYLGRKFALKAFQYAKAADPNALLFINEYNLESNPVKLDSLLGYVNELKTGGAPIDGIGTQMHISILTADTGIDRTFQKLAATGLKVRVSELDVRVNPNNQAGFLSLPVNPTLLAFQADKIKYVVSSYIRNVPAAQRAGITVWGVDDPESWIITSQKQQDAPLLFDKNFAKKPAYSGYLQGSQKGK